MRLRKSKLEDWVMPLHLGFFAALISAGINEDSAKEGIEAAQTYLIIPPLGIIGGYLLDQFYNFLERNGLDFYNIPGSGGTRVPKP